MLKELESISLRSITTRLWVQKLIKPVFIMTAFVRAFRTKGKLATSPLGSRANDAILFCVAPPDVFEMIKCGCATDIHPVRQRCVDAIQLSCQTQCFVDATGKYTAGMSTPDGLMTVTMLLKVTCSRIESNQCCNGNMHHHK